MMFSLVLNRVLFMDAKSRPQSAFSALSLLLNKETGRPTMSTPTVIEKQQRPIRAGIFSTVEETKDVISRLLAAGFTKDQITVICSDDTKERNFREFEHQEQAGSNTPAAMAAGGAIGATVGSLATGAVGMAIGGVPLIVAGGIGLMAGAVWGGFIGAMMTRGFEKAAANYYDQ